MFDAIATMFWKWLNHHDVTRDGAPDTADGFEVIEIGATSDMSVNIAGKIVTCVSKIGSGAYGEVYAMSDDTVGKHYISRGRRTATAAVCAAGSATTMGVPRDGLREIAILKGLAGRYVVSMRGVVYQGGELWCMMERATGGSLRDYLNDRHPDDAMKMRLVHQMFMGIAYVHSRNVIHRDIKPENLLVFCDATADVSSVCLKLADFGSALVHGAPNPSVNVPRTDPVTTMWYAAPEIIFGMVNLHTFAMDVWAAGLVACELSLSVLPLFKGSKDTRDVAFKICRILGVPTAANGLMPTYTSPSHPSSHHRAIIEPGWSDIAMHPHAHPATSDRCPSWAVGVLRASLVLEPTGRATAIACAKMCETLASGPSRAPCPRTPKISRPQNVGDDGSGSMRVDVGASMICGSRRRRIVDMMFETCIYARRCGSRREFHAAVKLYDRMRSMGAIGKTTVGPPSSDDERRDALCAAACSSIASKLCDGRGIGPEWCSVVRECLADDDRKDKGVAVAARVPLGVARYNLMASEVIDEETRILDALDWDVWDVTVLDVGVSDGVDYRFYCFLLDMIVASIDTCTNVPHDIAAVAMFIEETRRVNRNAVRMFHARLMSLLEEGIRVVDASVPPGSMMHRVYSNMCGPAAVDFRVGVDLDRIRWMV